MATKYAIKKSRALGSAVNAPATSKLGDQPQPDPKASDASPAGDSTQKTASSVRKNETNAIKKPRKKHKWRPGTVALREIRKYQGLTDPLFALAPFKRLVYETLQQIENGTCGERMNITKGAVKLLYQETDAFASDFLGEVGTEAIKAGRITIMPCDVVEAKRLHVDKLTMNRRPRMDADGTALGPPTRDNVPDAESETEHETASP